MHPQALRLDRRLRAREGTNYVQKTNWGILAPKPERPVAVVCEIAHRLSQMTCLKWEIGTGDKAMKCLFWTDGKTAFPKRTEENERR